MKQTYKCNYSELDFRPPCPVKDCPANIQPEDGKSGCAFIEAGYNKEYLTKMDVARILNVSEATVSRGLKAGKEIIEDTARIVLFVRKNPDDGGQVLKLKGKFFEDFPVAITRNQFSMMLLDKKCAAALKRHTDKQQLKTERLIK